MTELLNCVGFNDPAPVLPYSASVGFLVLN